MKLVTSSLGALAPSMMANGKTTHAKHWHIIGMKIHRARLTDRHCRARKDTPTVPQIPTSTVNSMPEMSTAAYHKRVVSPAN